MRRIEPVEMTTHGPETSTELGETPPRVLLYSKPGCHLCDEARAVIEAVCADLGEQYDEVDITTSADLTARYGEEIPVTLVDGVQHDYWRVDAQRLRDALGRS
jgi:glutaredoxin